MSQNPNNNTPYGYNEPQNNGPYGQPSGQFNQKQPQQFGNYTVAPGEAEKLAKQAWIFGLIGLFVLGLVLGSIALYKAFKAKTLGANATAGFILGTLAILSHLGGLFLVFGNM